MAMLFVGLYLMLFPPVSVISQQKEMVTGISLPTPIPAHTTRQAVFSAQSGDSISFRVAPVTGFPPTPIWGHSVSVSVYFGSQVLYSNTGEKVDGTVNLPQTGTYSFQIVNDNDFEVMFQSNDLPNSYLSLHHPYIEYSQVSDTSLQSFSLVLIMISVVVGVASLLILVIQPKNTPQFQP
jgi:hypothetical protein